MKKHTASLPAVGAGSLLAAFAVLCLTVFALLSIGAVQAEKRTADASVQTVMDYYAADLEAEELFARLRNGELPPQVTRQQSIYTYQCEISAHQHLDVQIQKTETGWQVLRWQAVSLEPEAGAQTLPVWNGQSN